MPKNDIDDLDIFVFMTKFESSSHVFSHVYNYKINAPDVTAKPCLTKT
jgi:hypothetical protein